MSLAGWLKARRTEKAMGLVLEHSKMTIDAVELLSRCINSSIGGNKPEREKNFELLEQKEHEADVLRRRITEELARGSLPADERVGMMRLGRQIDWIADWSHEAGRILVLFDLSRYPKEIQEIALEMCSTVTECARHVVDMVTKLIDGEIEPSLRAADEVERLEEKVDDQYQKARKILRDLKTDNAPVGSIILIGQFLEAIENTADRCEDTCDQARVMAVRLSNE